ncbi:MAG: glycine cleavage T C-terminal barrel domain-containing protein, partial [Pseudomonadota bacterium]
WIKQQLGDRHLSITERDDLAMIALQGPNAASILTSMSGMAEFDQLRPFRFMLAGDWFIARTGYTGEDGCEIILPNGQAVALWNALVHLGAEPCGLGARDSLRLEAGLNLYGQDMTSVNSPLESNLVWTVAFEPAERDFIGRSALEAQRDAGVEQQLVGLVLGPGGIARTGAKVQTDAGVGVVTSGGFSPTLERPIAMARMPVGVAGEVAVALRGKQRSAQVVKMPFVRNGAMREGLLD